MGTKYYRDRPRRDVNHFTDVVNMNVVSTTVEILSSILPKLPVGTTDRNPGGTVVRMRINMTECVNLLAGANALKIWAVVAPIDATAASLPDPFVTGNLNQYANYLFVDEVTLGTSEVVQTANFNPEGFGRWDISAMRKMNDDEAIHIVTKADAASARLSLVIRVWWKTAV